jgi:hemoglobin-like flavoprotein
LWHVVVEVACAEYDEHVEVALLNEVEHIVLAYDALLDAWSEVFTTIAFLSVKT